MPKPIRVGSANIAKENRAPRNAVAAVYRNTDLAGLQETETALNRRWVSLLSRFYGMRVFWPGNVHPDGAKGKAKRFGTPANAVPIVYASRRFQLHGYSVALINKGQSGNFPNRYLATVVLRDKRTNVLFHFSNAHMVPGAWSGRLPGNQPEWNSAAHHIEAAAHRWRLGPFMAAGDWNRHRWVPKGLKVQFSARGTHGNAHYDDVKHNDRVAVRNPRTVNLPGSDHDMYVCDVVFR